MKYALISAVAKKNLSRSDLAQHYLHRSYELHTGPMFFPQTKLANSFWVNEKLVRLFLFDNTSLANFVI